MTAAQHLETPTEPSTATGDRQKMGNLFAAAANDETFRNYASDASPVTTMTYPMRTVTVCRG